MLKTTNKFQSVDSKPKQEGDLIDLRVPTRGVSVIIAVEALKIKGSFNAPSNKLLSPDPI